MIVVTPARNEEEFIGDMLQSVFAQTIKPSVFVVVDDGSEDETPIIISSYQRVWLLGLLNRGFRYRGAGVARVVNIGYEWANILRPDWRYFCKLDADMILPRNYFEVLLQRFAEDPQLGIASGVVNGEPTNPEHPRGGARIYRRSCWEQIGGKLPEIHGWDTYTDLRARQFGYKTRGFKDIMIVQQRDTAGRERKMRAAYNEGRMMKLLGYQPLVVVARSLQKNLLKTLVTILSYALPQNHLMILPKDFYRYVKREQKQRIVSFPKGLT